LRRSSLFVRVSSLTILLLLTSVCWPYEVRFLENGSPLDRGSDSGFLLDTPTRIKIDLSGEWKYNIDGGLSGKVRIPSSYDFVGKVVFERKFTITAEQLDSLDFSLVMFGVNYSAEIWINGDFVANHVGGYTSFIRPIPRGVLHIGDENVIIVTVSNELSPERTIPFRPGAWGWRNYGGITRDLFLLGVPKLSIRKVVVGSRLSVSMTSAEVSVRATVESSRARADSMAAITRPGSGPAIYCEIVDKISGAPVARSPRIPVKQENGQWQDVSLVFTVPGAKLWSPETPDMYLLRCYLGIAVGRQFTLVDQYDLNCGFRRMTIKDGALLLNERPITIRGVIWMEDHPTWGASLTYEEMEKDIVLIKNLGANAVRFLYHPPHPYMLNLCDRYGLLALEELPVVGVPAPILRQDSYIDIASAMVDEMVMRDAHHPSVLAWGLGDEFESTSVDARKYVETLRDEIRSLDDRPVYFAQRPTSRDQCSDLVDFAMINPHTPDLRQFKKDLQEWKRLHPEMPMIVGKFGTEVQNENRNGYSDPLSYEAQARYFLQRLDVINSLDFSGAYVLSFNDWKGDRPSLIVHSGDPWMYSFGLVSSTRDRRTAYDAVRSEFRKERFVALPIGSFSADAPIIYVLAGLVVLVALAYFYNASRRFRDSLTRSLSNSYNFFSDIRDQHSVSLVHTTLLGAIISLAVGIVTSSILLHFRSSWILDNLLSYTLLYDDVKEAVVLLIWSPLQSIVYFSLIVFGLILVHTLFLMLVGPLFRSRLHLYHAYTITVWSASPLLLLVPVGMILYRVMESPMYVLPSVLLPILLLVWVFFRWMKGVAIVTDVFRPRVYSLGLMLAVAIVGIAFFYLDYRESISVFLSYLYDVTVHS